MASPLEPGSSLSTISPSGTPQVTPSVSRQSSRLTESGEDSASRRPSKVMFTSTPKSERSRGASSEQLRRDSSGSMLSDIDQLRRNNSTISDREQLHRDSGVLSDRRDSSNLSTQSDQVRRDSSVLSGQLRRDSSNLSTQSDQLRRNSSVLSDRDQLRRDSSVLSNRADSSALSNENGQLRRDSNVLSDQPHRDSSIMSAQSDQPRRDSSVLSDNDQPRRDSSVLSDQLHRNDSMQSDRGQLRRDSSLLSDQVHRDSSVLSGQLRRDSSMLAQLRRDSRTMSTQSDQLRRDSSTLSDRYPSTLCTNDLEAWDSLPRGYLTSSSSGLLSPQKSQEKGDVLTRESTPASSRMFAGSAERSRDTFARDFPSMPSLQSQSSHQSHDANTPLARVSSGPSELTSQEKSSDMDTSLSNKTSFGSTTKLFSAPSQESTTSSLQTVQEPSVGTTPVLSPRRSHESSAEALGSPRSTSKTSTRESSSLLGGVRHKATAMTQGSGPSGAESSSGLPDDSEILRRLTNMNERMCNENDLLRKQLKLFRRNAELKQISLISLVIAWHQGLISADECESLSELSQLSSEDGSGGASVVSGRRLSSSVREIKRVLHHLERTLIDLDSTVRDHQCLWRDVRRQGTLALPAPGSNEGVSAPRLYIPRPHAEQQGAAGLGEGVSALYTSRPHAEHPGTAVQFEKKEAAQPNDSGLGGSFSERATFPGGEQKMDSKARRTSETHDVREARLLGEVCHQLEQRVLVSVFPRQKIDPSSFSLRTIGDLVRLERDPDEKEFLTRKLGRVTATLRLYGFDFQRHPFFMTDVMLRFGKFPTDWDKYNFVHQKGYHDPELLRETVGRLVPVTIVTRVLPPGYHDPELLREAVGRLVPEPFRYDMLVVLDCLLAMAREDGCSIFLW
uniref:Speriolin C-terminal domain-containing protein n=1 Tax=Branchiostoma floridae TaxID=7739 RepID=C3XWV0_BRAFL|eukprot:XP_002611200.1 hypothetical protein BRAFLDRAFT_119647 [Branchiostoma floridae]